MMVVLETKNKEKFITGQFPCPPITDPLHDAWRRCNRMVMAWLTRSMSPSIKQSVMWMDTATEIWTDLKDRFSHSDKFRVADLQDQIQNCKQGDSSISEYYTRLKILWKEIEMYRLVLICTCSPSCSCGLLQKLQKEREDDCVIHFLRGLNDEYSQVRSQIMMMDPMPSIVKSFSMILQHEREFVGNSSKPSSQDSIAFTVSRNDQSKYNSKTKNTITVNKNNTNFGKPSGRNNKYCEHCKKTNHTVDTCYWKIGFPTGYRKSNKGTSSSFAASASLVEVAPDTASHHSDLVENANCEQISFSKEQYQAIMALLQNSKDNSTSVNHAQTSTINHSGDVSCSFSWILDSGATDHICPSKSLFKFLKPIKPITIRLSK
uniref:Uncharacterized protein n=1 Tax=Cajanus cajan TaxID=3821 RepID=A0A151TYY5_CAJCA|nr:hypothetical protein KK1_004784 [Cajanus cajan]